MLLTDSSTVLMHTSFSKRRVGGFTLVELLVSLAMIAVLVGLLLPALARPGKSPRIKCVNNLKNIGLAFRIFATDHQDRFPMQVSTNEGGSMEFTDDGVAFRHFLAMSNELSTPKIIVCPADSKRQPALSFSAVRPANVSYFVPLDTPQALLSGDRNLTTNGRPVRPGIVKLTTNILVGWSSEIHNLSGNVALGDGSVQQLTGPRLAAVLSGAGQATNRIAVP